MQIKKNHLSKLILSIISISFVIVFSVLFWNLQVSSQTEVMTQNKNIAVDHQAKEDEENDGVQAFIDILTGEDKDTSPAKKIDAIKRLGDANAKRAISVLIKYLDYEDTSIPTRNADSIDISEGSYVSPVKRYPAIGSLAQIGEAALPVLVKVLEEQPLNSIRSKNARATIQYIFLRGNMLDGVLYLEKAASESQVSNGSERLKMAAQEMRKLLEKKRK